jgi:hypothetical protein
MCYFKNKNTLIDINSYIFMCAIIFLAVSNLVSNHLGIEPEDHLAGEVQMLLYCRLHKGKGGGQKGPGGWRRHLLLHLLYIYTFVLYHEPRSVSRYHAIVRVDLLTPQNY